MLLSSKFVRRRLLEVLGSCSLDTATDITKCYNNRYPPSRIGRLFGKGMSVRSTLKHLEVLYEAGFVRKELVATSNQMTDRRIAHYTITPAGLHQLVART